MREKILLFLFFPLFAFAESLPLPNASTQERVQLPECFYRLYPVDDGKLEDAFTRVWLSYDEQQLRIHIETPWQDDFLKGTPSRRDEGTNSERISLKLITNADSRLGYGFDFYPLGNLYDYSLEGVSQNNDWDGNYSYTSDIGGHTWAIEAAIPFVGLRLPGKAPYRFKIVITRLYNRNYETYICPKINQQEEDEIYTKGMEITVPEEVQNNSFRVKFKPYITRQYDLMKKTQTYDPDHVGLDVDMSFNSSTKVKLTLRPDFSDIPLDNVVNVYNMQNSPIYDENRYFFKDDLYVLSLPSLMLYTRNINQPDIAAKVTYSGSDSQFGYLVAQDKKISNNGYVNVYDDTYQAFAYTRTTVEHTLKYGLTARSNNNFTSMMQMARDEWRFTPDQTLYLTAYHSYNDTNRNTEKIDNRHGFGTATEYIFSIPNWRANISAMWYNKYLLSYAGTMNPNFGSNCNNYFWPSGTLTYYRSYDNRLVKSWSLKFAASYDDYLADNTADPWYGSIAFDVNTDKSQVELFYSHGEDAITTANYSSDMFFADYYNTDLAWLNWHCGWAMNKSVVYDLAAIHNSRRYLIGVTGNVAGLASYSLEGRFYDYALNPDSLFTDNEYLLLNAMLTFNPSSVIMLRLGCNLDTYQTDYLTDNIGFYGNFSWEFKPDCTLYLGYTTRRYQEENKMEEFDFSKFKSYYETAYVKLGYTF